MTEATVYQGMCEDRRVEDRQQGAHDEGAHHLAKRMSIYTFDWEFGPRLPMFPTAAIDTSIRSVER